MSTLQVATIKSDTLSPPLFKDSSGTEIGTLCRSWVNLSSGTGTPTIRSSFNVSSITDGGVGNFTINFTTAMPDANYCVLSVANEGTSVTARESQFGTQTTSSVQVLTRTFASGVNSGTLADFFQNHVAVFR